MKQVFPFLMILLASCDPGPVPDVLKPSPERCRLYAGAAMTHEQENQKLGCYPDWKLNSEEEHFAWCSSHSLQEIEAQEKNRISMYQRCGWCDGYAIQAVLDEQKNQKGNCFPDWEVHKAVDHIRWCLSVSEAEANKQRNNRFNMLRGCAPRFP